MGWQSKARYFQCLENIKVGKRVPMGLWETRLSLEHVLRSVLACFTHLQWLPLVISHLYCL